MLRLLCCVFLTRSLASPLFPAPVALDPWEVAGVRTEALNFNSATESGDVVLHGTLFLPETAQGNAEFPGVLLVSGSGPNNRYESATNQVFATELPEPEPLDGGFCYYRAVSVHPLFDIAMSLAQRGFAVYSYDKRTCTSEPCENTFCVNANQLGCVNATLLQYTDFVTDAGNALKALQGHRSVQASNLTVMGHSQGCNIAPYVAVNNSDVTRTVLLMGTGSDITGTMYRQTYQILQSSVSILNESLCDPSDSVQKQILDGAGQIYDLSAATQQAVLPILDSWHAGVNPYPPLAMLSLGLFGTGTSQFFFQWIKQSMPATYQGTLAAFLNRPEAKLLAINSNTDPNVAPADYLPLRAMLSNLKGTEHVTLPGLTHFMGPVTLEVGNVSQVVLDKIGAFLSDGMSAGLVV